MRLRILFEDLDDKDEFGNPCVMCGDRIEDTEFHLAHTEAHDAAVEAVGLDRSPYFPTWIKVFKDAMAKHGYYPIQEPRPRAPHDLLRGEIWIKKPLKEDLDDKDEFSSNYAGCPFGCTDQDRELHDAHRAALRAGDEAQEQSYSELDSLPLSTEERHKRIHIIWSKAFDLEMNRRGYVSKVPSTSLTTNGFYANVWTKR